MSISLRSKIIKKARPSKSSSQVKIVSKPQPCGLSREEIRAIVIEMIG